MQNRPNIVLIVADDMGYGDFGVFNDGTAQTPNLDQLYSESICLTQHYSASPVCAPARAGLLTGRYPHRTGAVSVMEVRGQDRIALREMTLADILKSAGYITGLVGKWHSGALDPRYHPNARGFDEFVGFCGGWSDYYDWSLDYNGQPRQSDGRYLTDVFTDEAVSFVNRHSKEPFFLHLAYNAPHSPFQVPEEELKPFLSNKKLSHYVRIIYGMIRRMDKGIERLLAEIRKQGIEDHTLVLFTSDNGPQFTSTSSDINTTRFNCGFAGAKMYVYEGGIRVPMLLRWPDGLGGGRLLTDMVHFVDWMPTLLAAAEIEVPRELNLDGENVLPVLRGEEKREAAKRFWQWNHYTPVGTCNAAMRDQEWKLVRPSIPEAMAADPEDWKMDAQFKLAPDSITGIYRGPEPKRVIPPPPPAQLFNIENDPLEQNDLAGAEPERTARMLKDLEHWFDEVETERREIPDEKGSR
jgi:arylsulfatase A-like enzyme